MKLLMWLSIALLISVLIEWIGMLFGFWELPGAQHAQHVFEQEWGYLNQSTASAIVDMTAMGKIGEGLFATLYFWVFKFTGIEWVFSELTFFKAVAQYAEATLFVTKTFIARLVIIVLSMPVFLLFAFWGLLEGFVRRDLRKYGSDWEKSARYHYIKMFVGTIFITPIVVYLSNPFSINPAFVFTPFALLVGYLIASLITNLTKYI